MRIFGKTGKKGSQKSVWPFMSKGIHDKKRGRLFGKRIGRERRAFNMSVTGRPFG